MSLAAKSSSVKGKAVSSYPNNGSCLDPFRALFYRGCFKSDLGGTVNFRPLEVVLTSKRYSDNIQAYCKISIGFHKLRTLTTRLEDKGTFSDEIVLERKHDEEFAKLKVRDKGKKVFHTRLGDARIDLDVVATLGQMKRWYALKRGEKVTGKILMEIIYNPYVQPTEER